MEVNDSSEVKHNSERNSKGPFRDIRVYSRTRPDTIPRATVNTFPLHLGRSDCALEHLPVVLVVLEGGYDTIKKGQCVCVSLPVPFSPTIDCLVHESVTQHDIPVVLLEGTGGCCDLFSKCSQLYDEYHSNVFARQEVINDPSDESPSADDKHEQIKRKLREKLQVIDMKLNSSSSTETSDGNDGIDYFELVYECIHTRRVFLNFIDLKVHGHIGPDLDLAILQALLSGEGEAGVFSSSSSSSSSSS